MVFGYSVSKTFYRFEGGRMVCYSYRIDYDAVGREKGRTEPEAISSIGWSGGSPFTESDFKEIMRYAAQA